MTRFTLGLMATWSCAIGAAVVLFSFGGSFEPYLTVEEVRALGLSPTSCQALFWEPSPGVVAYETYITFPQDAGQIWVSVRREAGEAHFEGRRQRQLSGPTLDGRSRPTVIDESEREERRFRVRHDDWGEVRLELVRLRGSDLLSVQTSILKSAGRSTAERMSECERLADAVEKVVRTKLNWPE